MALRRCLNAMSSIVRAGTVTRVQATTELSWVALWILSSAIIPKIGSQIKQIVVYSQTFQMAFCELAEITYRTKTQTIGDRHLMTVVIA